MALSGFSKVHFTAATAGQLLGPGTTVLHTVTFNTGAATSTIVLYDTNTVASIGASNMVASITAPGAATPPVTLIYDAICGTGLVAVVTGTADITVTYS